MWAILGNTVYMLATCMWAPCGHCHALLQVAALSEAAGKGSARGLAFSPDNTHLVVASTDKSAHVWKLESPISGKAAKVATLSGHLDALSSVAWSPKGDVIATGSQDTMVSESDASQMVLDGIVKIPEEIGESDGAKMVPIQILEESAHWAYLGM